jgi:hypothetical protein
MALDKEKIKQKIAIIDEKIGAEADPRLLGEYRTLFKKGISFFRRSWAAAYLLMLYDQGEGFDLGRERGPGRSKTRGPAWGERERISSRSEGPGKQDDGETGGRAADSVPRPFLPEDESRRLFISIGRNRHVFPREILGLIITRAQVAREDIGMIRILDSYSFVQVRDTVADTIIEALNGTMFRGRPLTANYARLKREEGSAEGESLETDAAESPVDTAFIAEKAPDEPYVEDDAGIPEPDEDYPGAPEQDGDYLTGDYPKGDYPDDSEQGDDQDDEEGVEDDTPQQ